MAFKDSVWNDSEPLYAPCQKRIKSNCYWVPPKKYKDDGYSITSYRLEGTEGDGDDLKRAAHCRLLTREMLDWQTQKVKGRKAGTWGFFITKYLHDEYSDLRSVQPSTRAQYIKEIRRIEAGIADVNVADTDYTLLMEWKVRMEAKGRSVSFIKKWFTHFGLILSHGVKLGDDDCAKVQRIRSQMRIRTPARRSVFITREQAYAVINEADKRGLTHVSLAILFRFEYLLRGVDVQGEWEPAEGRTGGVQNNGRMWVKGLTWEMFSPDLRTFSKVISKTAKSMPEPYHFDLIPEIRDRMLLIPTEQRVGPLITLPNGRPPMTSIITRTFKKIVRDLGLPDELQIRDSRAGGITEAKDLVGTRTLQHAAQHTQSSTTDIYVRGQSDAANKVVQLRTARK